MPTTRETDPAQDSPRPDMIGSGLARPEIEPLAPGAILTPLRQAADYLRRLYVLAEARIGRLAHYRTWATSLSAGQSVTYRVDVDLDAWHVWSTGAASDRLAVAPRDAVSGDAPVIPGLTAIIIPGHTRTLTVSVTVGSSVPVYVVAVSGLTFGVRL